MGLLSFLGVLSPAHISLFSWLNRKERVGEDSFGNVYYRGEARKGYKRERRWVIYNGAPEASTVPPEWHSWLHHQNDNIPASTGETFRRPWQKPHKPNMTGTNEAYRPSQHLLGKKTGTQSTTGEYEAWQPPK